MEARPGLQSKFQDSQSYTEKNPVWKNHPPPKKKKKDGNWYLALGIKKLGGNYVSIIVVLKEV
jgi:hypothetical protein